MDNGANNVKFLFDEKIHIYVGQYNCSISYELSDMFQPFCRQAV